MLYKVKILPGIISSWLENRRDGCACTYWSRSPLEVTSIILFSTTKPLMLHTRVRVLLTASENWGLKPCFSIVLSISASHPSHNSCWPDVAVLSLLSWNFQVCHVPGCEQALPYTCELLAGRASCGLSHCFPIASGRGLYQHHATPPCEGFTPVSERHLRNGTWEQCYCSAITV